MTLRVFLPHVTYHISAEKRRKEREERRLLREKKIEESLHIWERDILPDWRVVHKNPALRKLWWKGIPAKLRSTMWERAVGNPLALSKGWYIAFVQVPSADQFRHISYVSVAS